MNTLPPTVVRYDVAQALSALRQLRDAARNALKQVGEDFDKAGQASKGFENVLGTISPRAGNALSSLRSFSGGLSGATAAVGGLTLGVTALATNMVNLPEIFRDANQQLADFNEGVERQVELLEKVGDISDAKTLRGFEERLRANTAQKAALAERQAAIGEARESIREEIEAHQKKYDAINAASRESIQVRKSHEEQLAGLLEKREDRQLGGLPIGRQFQELLSRAAQAREGGDFQRAERLLDKASQAAQQQGGHAFFTKQVAEEEDKLIGSLQKSVSARQAADQARQGSLNLIQAEIDALKELDQERQKEERALGRQRKVLRSEGQQIGLERKAFVDQDKAETASNIAQGALAQMDAAANRVTGTFDNIVDVLRLTKDRFIGGSGFTGVSRQKESVATLEGQVDFANRLSQTGDPEQIKRAGEVMAEVLRDLNTIKQDPGLSEGLRSRIQAIEEFDKAFKKLSGAAALSNDAGVPLNQAIARRPGVDFGQSQTGGSGNFSPLTGGVSPNISVNATIQGGMIDNQTAEAFTDIIIRKLRTLTSKPLSN